jgi:hypothetical protein
VNRWICSPFKDCIKFSAISNKLKSAWKRKEKKWENFHNLVIFYIFFFQFEIQMQFLKSRWLRDLFKFLSRKKNASTNLDLTLW